MGPGANLVGRGKQKGGLAYFSRPPALPSPPPHNRTAAEAIEGVNHYVCECRCRRRRRRCCCCCRCCNHRQRRFFLRVCKPRLPFRTNPFRRKEKGGKGMKRDSLFRHRHRLMQEFEAKSQAGEEGICGRYLPTRKSATILVSK